MAVKNTSDNPAANIMKCYYTRYYRPILYFEVSPFFSHIFMTVHDFHFCLWYEGRTKPIFISPNLSSLFLYERNKNEKAQSHDWAIST